MAERIQLRRVKGWRKPAGAVVVSRPSRYGNPHRLGTKGSAALQRGLAVEKFRRSLAAGALKVTIDEIRRDLAGKDLACWCPLDQPCHADVLLEVANSRSGPELAR